MAGTAGIEVSQESIYSSVPGQSKLAFKLYPGPGYKPAQARMLEQR